MPSETAICSSLASQNVPTAAMALPPQIAVPVEIRKAAGVLCIPSKAPRTMPATIAKLMLNNGIDEAVATRTDHIVQVHAEAESDY